MLNKVTLIGRLGSDPEIRYMPNGNPVANISIATTRKWKNKQSGEKREETEWHRTVFFNRLAEIAGEYLRKGSLVYIEGRIRTQKWQDKNGQDRYTTEIVGEQMTMLDSKSDSQAGSQQQASSPNKQPEQNKSDQPPPATYPDYDDDIPY